MRKNFRTGTVIGVLLLALSCTTFSPQPSRENVRPAIEKAAVVAELMPLEIPAVRPGEKVYARAGFSFSYDPKTRLANWVAYRLDSDHLANKVTERGTTFHYDKGVEGSPKPDEYTKSGYDKGHLAPAADFRWSKEAMKDCFLMTNIAPQLASFNRRIWKNLETRVRQWAGKTAHSFIVTGPVHSSGCQAKLRSDLCVPKQFFKAVLQTDGQAYRAIGFVIPQNYTDPDLKDYAQTIDAVEKIAALDLFPSLPDSLEDAVEAALPTSEVWWN